MSNTKKYEERVESRVIENTTRKITTNIVPNNNDTTQKIQYTSSFRNDESRLSQNNALPTTWNYNKQQPQQLVTSDKINTLVAEYDVSRKEIVQRIVDEASKSYNRQDKTKYELLKESQNINKDYTPLIFDNHNQSRRIIENINLESIHEVDHKYTLHEIHHIERPITVQTLDQVTRNWQAKFIVLERQKAQLEHLINRSLLYGKHETRQIKVENHQVISKLESEINNLNEQIKLKDKALDDLQDKEEHLETELESVSETTTKGTQEENIWKQKFSDANKIYHDIQEDLMMKQAELDSLRNKKVTVQKTVVTSSQQRTGGDPIEIKDTMYPMRVQGEELRRSQENDSSYRKSQFAPQKKDEYLAKQLTGHY